MTVAQLIFTCAGALLVLENKHWLWIGAHRDTYPNSFFDALYLSIMTATGVGYVLLRQRDGVISCLVSLSVGHQPGLPSPLPTLS